jgi:hypothetical protein
VITFKNYVRLNEVATSAPQSASYGGGRVTENHNGVRRLPLSASLKTAIQNGLNGTGLDWRSSSGGQPSSGPNRVGSHRHDNGNGSDGDFVESGTSRVLNADNPQDRQKIASALTRLKQAGVQGFGWDSASTGNGHYMGSTRFHLDVAGPPGVWGSSKSSNTAAPWIVSALGGAPQGNVVGDEGEAQNMPPGQDQEETDYPDVASAANALSQGIQQVFGGGVFQ